MTIALTTEVRELAIVMASKRARRLGGGAGLNEMAVDLEAKLYGQSRKEGAVRWIFVTHLRLLALGFGLAKGWIASSAAN